MGWLANALKQTTRGLRHFRTGSAIAGGGLASAAAGSGKLALGGTAVVGGGYLGFKGIDSFIYTIGEKFGLVEPDSEREFSPEGMGMFGVIGMLAAAAIAWVASAGAAGIALAAGVGGVAAAVAGGYLGGDVAAKTIAQGQQALSASTPPKENTADGASQGAEQSQGQGEPVVAQRTPTSAGRESGAIRSA